MCERSGFVLMLIFSISPVTVIRPKITCLDFKKSKLTLVVVEDDDQVTCTYSLSPVLPHATPLYTCCLVKVTDPTIGFICLKQAQVK